MTAIKLDLTEKLKLEKFPNFTVQIIETVKVDTFFMIFDKFNSYIESLTTEDIQTLIKCFNNQEIHTYEY